MTKGLMTLIPDAWVGAAPPPVLAVGDGAATVTSFMGSFIDLGIMMLAAVYLGRWASRLHIPRVTAYLALGVLLGPSLLGAVPKMLGQEGPAGWLAVVIDTLSLQPDSVAQLAFIRDFALQAIVFAIGGEFAFPRLRKYRRNIWLLAGGDVIVSFLLVGLTVLLIAWVVGGENPLGIALLLGAIGIATAPAATLMVIREYEADGPVKEKLLILTGLNNLVAIVLFGVVAGVWLGAPSEIIWTLAGILGSVVTGILAGLLLCWIERRVEEPRDRLLVLLGMLMLTLGIGRIVPFFEPMAIALAFGVTVGNASLREGSWFEDLKAFEHPFGVGFFVLAGAALHLDLLPMVGFVGLAYVLARLVAKYVGPLLGVWLAGGMQNVRHTIGLGLTAQAGVAIGLAGALVRRASGTPLSEAAVQVETVVLAAVIAFEIIGPLLVRYTLVHAGEVKAVSLVPVHPMDHSFSHVLEQLRYRLGFMPRRAPQAGRLRVKDIMRRNVETIREDTPFGKILDIMHHSPYDQIPVITEDKRYLGTITHAEVRDLVFDPVFQDLVVARDLVIPDSPTASPEQSVQLLVAQFELLQGEYRYLPVVSQTEETDTEDGSVRRRSWVVGIVAQTDALRAVRTGQCKGYQAPVPDGDLPDGDSMNPQKAPPSADPIEQASSEPDSATGP